MSHSYVELPLDRSGRNPNNLMGSETHTPINLGGTGFRITTLEHGGFYKKSFKAFDSNYEELKIGEDYVLTYMHKDISEYLGLEVYSAVVILNPEVTSEIYTSAQMVGGDIAYSFTVVDDYTLFVNSKDSSYVPYTGDYLGNEPIYPVGTLAKLRWNLDTFQPFNNEITNIGNSYIGATGTHEEEYREKVIIEYDRILSLFNNRLDLHIGDKNNPHQNRRDQVGLGIVRNLKVATQVEALGTSDSLYLTPHLLTEVLNVKAIEPLNLHLAKRGNPHNVTPNQVDSYIPAEIDQLIANKYNVQEVVENATLGVFNGEKNYSQILAEFRKDIPADNFGHGYVHPNNIARGSPSSTTVYLSDSKRWTDWSTFVSQRPTVGAGSVYFASFGNVSRGHAHNLVVTTPPFSTAPNGSLIFYTVREVKSRGSGNGSYSFTHYAHYASYKNYNGLWVTV